MGTLPLAPISDVGQGQLPGVIRRMEKRLRRERQAKELWQATEVLLGLRYPPDVVDILLQGVTGMKESSTYQRIVAEGLAQGRAEGARHFLLGLGEDKFGPADEQTRAAIDAIADVKRLVELGKRVQAVANWPELLGRPAPRRRNGRRKAGRG